VADVVVLRAATDDSNSNSDNGRNKGILSKIAKTGRRSLRCGSPVLSASSTLKGPAGPCAALSHVRYILTVGSCGDGRVVQFFLLSVFASGRRRSPICCASPAVPLPEIDDVRFALQVDSERVGERLRGVG
jgi:hypothetical protein